MAYCLISVFIITKQYVNTVTEPNKGHIEPVWEKHEITFKKLSQTRNKH
jgi:hypothetical protein